MQAQHTAYSSSNMLFEFRSLEALPCGCVAADYVAKLLSLGVVAVEAKGPYCKVGHHAHGSLLTPDELGRGAPAAAWV